MPEIPTRRRKPDTFLQFVCEELLGPPAHHGGQTGDSYWPCPFRKHKEVCFHTLPVHPSYPDRWRCFGCGNWGDEFQLLRNLRAAGRSEAAGNFGTHQLRIERWRREYDALPDYIPSTPSTGRRKGEASLPPAESPPLPRPVDPLRLEEAVSALTVADIIALTRIMRVAREHGVSVQDFVDLTERVFRRFALMDFLKDVSEYWDEVES
jgi:hypothetical protein